jgi:hypothetical protein
VTGKVLITIYCEITWNATTSQSKNGYLPVQMCILHV